MLGLSFSLTSDPSIGNVRHSATGEAVVRDGLHRWNLLIERPDSVGVGLPAGVGLVEADGEGKANFHGLSFFLLVGDDGTSVFTRGRLNQPRQSKWLQPLVLGLDESCDMG